MSRSGGAQSADVDAGRLEWTVFPGPRPFVSCTRLDGRPISPVEAHRLLVDAGHEDAELTYMGDDWASRVEHRQPM